MSISTAKSAAQEVLAQMRERLIGVERARRPRKTLRVSIDDMIAYADALARTLDERNEFAARVRGPSTPDARAPHTMPVR